MLNLINRLIRKRYQPLNNIEISSKNLASNYKYITSLYQNISIAPVLKSNAYGHGLTTLAPVLDELKYPFFCVDSLYEAYELLKIKIKTPILIMGYVDPENLKYKRLSFSYTVWNFEQALAISKYQPHAGLHIFLDTGMNREGVSIDDLPKLIEKLKQKKISIEGLMSHLAIYTKNQAYPSYQLNNYQKALKVCQNLGVSFKWKHVAATGGLLNKYTKGTNLARVGMGLYGIDRENISKGKLKPVLSLKSKIIQIKKIKKGMKVGYDGTFQADKDMVIGILPIGYNDGVDRRLSNKGVVQVAGAICPIIGRISMNVTTIDLSLVERPRHRQEVVVFSNSRKDPNSIENAAKICGSLPHDILVHLDPSIRREITSSPD